MEIIVVIGLIISVVSSILVATIKKRISEEELVQYERNFKPKFVKVYYISMSPIFLLLTLFISKEINIIANNSTLFLSIIILVDMIAIYTTHILVNNLSKSNDFTKIKFSIFGMMIGKSISIIGLLLYIS